MSEWDGRRTEMWSASRAWRRPSVYDSTAVEMSALLTASKDQRATGWLRVGNDAGVYLWKCCGLSDERACHRDETAKEAHEHDASGCPHQHVRRRNRDDDGGGREGQPADARDTTVVHGRLVRPTAEERAVGSHALGVVGYGRSHASEAVARAEQPAGRRVSPHTVV